MLQSGICGTTSMPILLQVTIYSERACASCAPHLGDNIFSSLLAACSGPCGDQWRLQLLRIVHNAATAMSCSQAAALLGCFETHDNSDPIQVLLMSIHDVTNILTFEAAAVDCCDAYEHSALHDAYEQLGCPSAMLLDQNPSAHYCLDMSNQVCLLCMYSLRVVHIHSRSDWRQPFTGGNHSLLTAVVLNILREHADAQNCCNQVQQCTAGRSYVARHRV